MSDPLPLRPQDNQIKAFASRLESLEEQKRNTAEDIKLVLAEAKHAGVNPRALQMVLKRRAEDAATREKRQALESECEDYAAQLGVEW